MSQFDVDIFGLCSFFTPEVRQIVHVRGLV